MKTKSFITMITLALLSMATFAGKDKPATRNEDLQFIHQWNKTQKITATARALNLSSAQVATLGEIKARVDASDANYATRFEELEQRVADTAAAVRQRIETTGALSEADRALLKDLKRERRALNKERRLARQMAAIGLEDLLTPEQKNLLRDMAGQGREARGQRQRGERGEERRAARGGDSEPGQHRGARKVARLLLSDAFLAAYNQ